VPDLPEAVPSVASESSPPSASPPKGELTAAWERFRIEIGGPVPAAVGHEVSAIDTVFNELMRSGMDADRVFDLVVTSVAALTGATGSAIALAEGGRFVCRARYGSSAPPLGTRLDPSSGLSGLCVRTRHLLLCDDAELDPRVDSALSRETGIRSISVVPLIKDGKLVGIFELLSTRAHAFDKKATETLQRMSHLVVLTMTRMGELRGKQIEKRARGRGWMVLGLMVLAFLIGFAAARLLGPLLLR
jgi:signal transduction protein with GAF and PtsI domain